MQGYLRGQAWRCREEVPTHAFFTLSRQPGYINLQVRETGTVAALGEDIA